MGKVNKKVAYTSAALIALLTLSLVIALCLVMTETFKDTTSGGVTQRSGDAAFLKIFPGASMNRSLPERVRPFGQQWEQGRPQHGPNQPFSQWQTPDMKGTSLHTIDQLGTGREPIAIQWGQNWYNLP